MEAYMARYKLHTAICDLLGIEFPVLLAGMGPTAGRGGLGAAATAPLAAAVSEAGGLGVLGGAGSSPDQLRDQIRKVREHTRKPFGVDLLLPSNAVRLPPSGNGNSATDWRSQVPQQYWDALNELKRQLRIPDPPADRQEPRPTNWTVQDQIQVVFDERVPVFASGLGNPAPYVERCHQLGIKVIALVGNVKNARRVADGGADIVVAQGHEAGGHTGRIGTLALVPQVVDAVAPVPVVAAGGIGDGRGLAAALALGAFGVWCGTAFLATFEANIADWQKRRIVEATEEDTRVTRLYSGKTMRNVTNPLIEAWEALNIKALPMGMQGAMIGDLLAGIRASGNEELLMNAAGQVSGMIGGLRSAKDVVDDIVDRAAELLNGGLAERAQVSAAASAR
jgi:NAD(P)H-dependent flavin oxidoreductase YrpB (nitropropane dioxygenase family)